MNIEHAIIDQKKYFGNVIKTETGQILRYTTLDNSLSNTYEYEQCNTDKTQTHIFRQFQNSTLKAPSEIRIQLSNEDTQWQEISFTTTVNERKFTISWDQTNGLSDTSTIPVDQYSQCINHMRALIAFTQAIDVATEIGVALNVFIKSLNEELLQRYRNPIPKTV